MPRQQSSSGKTVQARSFAPQKPSQVVSATTNSSRPSFGQTLKEGFAFGIGNAIAHRLFGSTANAVHPIASSDVTHSSQKSKIRRHGQCQACHDNNDIHHFH